MYLDKAKRIAVVYQPQADDLAALINVSKDAVERIGRKNVTQGPRLTIPGEAARLVASDIETWEELWF